MAQYKMKIEQTKYPYNEYELVFSEWGDDVEEFLVTSSAHDDKGGRLSEACQLGDELMEWVEDAPAVGQYEIIPSGTCTLEVERIA